MYRVANGGRMPREIDRHYYWQMQAWQAMRIHREFTASELLRSMEEDLTTERTIRRWLKALSRFEYIRQVGPTTPGQETLYQIVMDVPDAPIVSLTGQEVRDD